MEKRAVKLAEVGVICSVRLNFSHSKSGMGEKTLDLFISFLLRHIDQITFFKSKVRRL